MMYRSDLALEAVDSFGSKIEGLLVREEKEGPITMTIVEILSQEASQQIETPWKVLHPAIAAFFRRHRPKRTGRASGCSYSAGNASGKRGSSGNGTGEPQPDS